MSANRVRLLSLVLVAGLGVSGRLHAQEPAAAVEADVLTVPVEVDGVPLFRVRGVSSFPADVRARRVRDQIVAVAANRSVPLDALRVVDSADVTRIFAGDLPIMGVVNADAVLEEVGRIELATAHLGRIKQAIADYRAARSPGALRRGIVNVLVATAALAIAVVALLRFTRRLDGLLARRARLHSRIPTVEIQSLELMRADRVWSALRSALLAVRTLAFLVLGLAYLGVALAQFPWTRGLSQSVAAFALSPLQVMVDGFVGNIPSLVFLIVLFFVVRLALGVVRVFFDAIAHDTVKFEHFEADWAQPTYKIVRFAVVAFALVVAYPYIPGSDTAAFQGVSLFIGILFSLGSTSAIANLVAGYMMIYRRALRVGDRVKIGDTVGDVIETRLQATYLRSYKNEEIIIPNSQIVLGEVLNYSSLARANGLILHTEVGIGYETPWRQVEAMLLAAAERTDGLSKDPPPFVLEKRLGDFAVVYELNAYCMNVTAMMRIYAEMHRSILDVFNEYGVQIMTPSYEADPAEPKVVPPQSWYAAPALGFAGDRSAVPARSDS